MRLVSVVSLLLVVSLAGGVAARQNDFTALERQAQAARGAKEPFTSRAALVAGLHAASEMATDEEQRGRLALLWLTSLRQLLQSIPFNSSQTEPYRSWLAKNELTAIYNEPAGQWMIHPELAWKVHDLHRATKVAEQIAWLTVENGTPGECEGFVPCYANRLNWVEGEYLRRHPRGAHAGEAVEHIRAVLTSSIEVLSEPFAKDFFNPPGDCGDLRKGLMPLREAVVASAAPNRSQAVQVIDRLIQRCP